MGGTGNATGIHLHYEVRNSSNKYGDVIEPSSILHIPKNVGFYNSKDFIINEKASENNTISIKKLASSTNLREAPGIDSKILGTYKKDTSILVIKSKIKQVNGHFWDYVEIKVTKKQGYMISDNYQ